MTDQQNVSEPPVPETQPLSEDIPQSRKKINGTMIVVIVAALLMCGALSTCFGGDDDSVPEDQAVEQPATDDAAPVQDAPAEVSADDAYIAAARTIVLDAGTELESIGSIAESGESADPTPYLTSMVHFQDIRDRFFELEPPARFEEFHALMQSALDDFTNSVESMAVAIDYSDMDRMEKAGEQMDSGATKSDEAMRLWAELVAE